MTGARKFENLWFREVRRALGGPRCVLMETSPAVWSPLLQAGVVAHHSVPEGSQVCWNMPPGFQLVGNPGQCLCAGRTLELCPWWGRQSCSFTSRGCCVLAGACPGCQWPHCCLALAAAKQPNLFEFQFCPWVLPWGSLLYTELLGGFCSCCLLRGWCCRDSGFGKHECSERVQTPQGPEQKTQRGQSEIGRGRLGVWEVPLGAPVTGSWICTPSGSATPEAQVFKREAQPQLLMS